MIRPRSWTSGKRDEFAVTLSFADDPDAGRGASAAMSGTWGSFEIWVNGLNLCQHRELDISLDEVHWYLLPLLRWFVTNWDALLHEERLPNRNEGRDAWQSLRATTDAPLALPDNEADAWGEAQQAWWLRHCLLSCREGGLFPNVYIRRMRDSIEFSWGPTEVSGAPEHYEFFASDGYARIDPQVVADHLSNVISSALAHLCAEAPQHREFGELQAAFQHIQNEDRVDRQLAWICGLHDLGRLSDERGTRLLHEIQNGTHVTRLSPFLSKERSRLVIRQAPQVCLMFGSVSPTIDDADVTRLIDLLASVHSTTPETESLRRMVRDEPIRSALVRPWDQGYRLADALHDALSDKYRQACPVDIENLLAQLGIAIANIALGDTTIRAVAIAGEKCRPTVAINTSYRFRQLHPRRFTLAHELCHLLHDRTHGVKLAFASGPWAPADIEKRANAFAAMFLMPSELIRSIIDELRLDLESVADLWTLSTRLRVSFTAAVEHICNLGFIDEEARDDLKQQAMQSPAAAVPQPQD